jgi:hypothetical protein
MTTVFQNLDSRKRLNLATIATTTQYLITTEESGRIILEPAVVMTQVERDYLTSSQTRAAVEAAAANPDDLVDRPARRKRKAA